MTWLLEAAPQEHYGEQLRRLLAEERPVVAPGAFSPLVGLMARRAGFRALYLSGAGLSAGLGIPDIGLFTLDELTTAVRSTVRAAGLPVIVDADTGFGEAVNVMRTVRELEDAGAAAVQIEDQVMPKRCGHLPGKEVIPARAMAEKVAAAVRARRHALIIARTDARATHGIAEARYRAELYAEAGADVIFPEALESEEEFAEFARSVSMPLLANMTEFGRTPMIPASRFGEMGYRIVIFPASALRVAAKAVETFLDALRESGTQEPWLDRMQTRRELYDLIGYDAYEEMDQTIARQMDGR